MGGDAPGLNAAIRGFGRAAVGEYGIELIGFLDGTRGLIENHFVTSDSSSFFRILAQGGTMLGTSRDKVHRMQVGKSKKDISEKILKVYEKNKFDIIITLGGGGTAKNALRLQKAGINAMRLSKTVDNDIWGTGNPIGFAIAPEVAAEAVDRLHSTAHSHHHVVLAEIMGHRTGWLALGAGIAGGVDIILIPEIPYNIEKVVEKIRRRKRLRKHFLIIAVAEGTMDVEYIRRIRIADQLIKGADSSKTKTLVKHDKGRLTDAHRKATFGLTHKPKTMTGLGSRVTILDYVQRGGTPMDADRLLATRPGAAGTAAMADGITGVMIAIKGGNTVDIPLEKTAGKVEFVPISRKWVKTTRGVETGLGD